MRTRSFSTLLPALRPEWASMAGSYAIATTSALTLVTLTVLSAWTVGHAVVDRSLPGLGWWLLLGGLVVVRTLLTWHEMDVSHALAYRVLARLRMALFDAFARSVPGKRREHSGEAASVALDDTEKLEFFYAHTVAQVGAALTVFLISTCTALLLLPAAGTVVLLGGALILTSAALCARTGRRLGGEEQRERTTMSAGIVDALGALREVLSYDLAPRVIAGTAAATARTTAVARRRELITEIAAAAREFTVTAVIIGVIVTAALAGGALGEGPAALPTAQLPALIAVAVAGVSAATEATTTIARLHPLTASADRVAAGITRPAVTRSTPGEAGLPEGPLGLRLSEVTFAFTASTPVLRSVSLDVAPGEHLGLAGPSGSGKSTLLALAARLWDPDDGSVAVRAANGALTPLSTIAEADLRAAIAVVDQDTTLFHGTVRENLLRGTEERADGELLAVLDDLGVSSWIGLNDMLGEHGTRLSGGQQARLCLARALVRRPRILLVDEVTASLDPATEAVISEAIAHFPGTVVFASHRRESLSRLSRVIDLANGSQ